MPLEVTQTKHENATLKTKGHWNTTPLIRGAIVKLNKRSKSTKSYANASPITFQVGHNHKCLFDTENN